ncbi:hypothetical protein [Chenggangzhangella methanolivorans]|uniref:Uncharacterized protein n=1 Tax=Chenggangzhangella methanolivorans TaxID=1437009 RepID=A0A9E6RIC6_9HYPH|nr:hypothetical protein [Chenggangzhangella methanolivorans]QZO01552.1 hypothetical protein K6K41_09095 [Chenggangzhangella methanolivorans]
MNGDGLDAFFSGSPAAYVVGALAIVLFGAIVLRILRWLAFLAFAAMLVVGLSGAYAVGLVKSPFGAPTPHPQRSAIDEEIVTGSIPPAAISAASVYIQAPDMDARFAADEMWRALKAAGIPSPGIELVGGGAPARPEVRYFDDADRPLADRVAAIAARQGLDGATVLRASARYQAPRGRIELWYPR